MRRDGGGRRRGEKCRGEGKRRKEEEKWREKWRREGEKGKEREKGAGWRDSKFRIPPNNSVAHPWHMRHRIFFPFFDFFYFAGKILLLAITFFSFGILRI